MGRLTDDLCALRNKLCGVDKPSCDRIEDAIESIIEDLPEALCGGGNQITKIKRVVSLDEKNMVNLRDLESGIYILYGYFKPFPDCTSTLIIDDGFYMVARVDEGSHLLCISPLNFRLTCHEILVDSSVAEGFTYNNTRINLLDVAALIAEK